MKKLFTLISVALVAMGVSAQTESYKAITVDGDVITLAPEFSALIDDGNNATNVADGKSIVTVNTANMTLEAVGGATIADKVDPENPTVNLGQDLVPGAVIDAEAHTYEIASVGSWNPIQWKNGNNKLDINDANNTKLYFLMGTGNPYVNMFCEEVYRDGEATGTYRAQYEYYKPGGQTMPLVGLYYKFSPKVDGKLRVQIWANKGNRHTYVIDGETKEAVDYSAEGYINGQRANYTTQAIDPETGEPRVDNQGNPIYEQYQIFFTSEQIDSIHRSIQCTTDTLPSGEVVYTEKDELYGPYIIAGGNQAFWGWITFEVKAGKTYWLFQDSSQVGFGGFDFTTGDDTPDPGNDLTAIVAQATASQSGDVTVNLEEGKEYTMSGPIQYSKLTIAGAEGKTKVTMAEGATFVLSGNNITLQNLDFEAAANSKALFTVSENPNGAVSAENDYHIIDNINLKDCNISNIDQIINDKTEAGIKYCVANFVVDNCVVSLNSIATKTVFDMHNKGFVNNLTVKNSTFYSKGIDQDYFVRYENAGRCDRAGFESNSINYENNTFYNVAKTGQWGNYNGFAGRGTSLWVMKKNIFVDCGSGQVTRRFLHSRGNQSTATFEYNTYWFDGAAEDTGNYDTSETILASDPQFVDAANANFTPQGADQLTNQTGDPRWLTDGIENVTTRMEDANAPVYNLAGQRVSPTTKGILIKNGRKYINK